MQRTAVHVLDTEDDSSAFHSDSKDLSRFTLLVLLAERPGHGYDLVRRLNDLGMPLGQRSVYRMLSDFERAGLIEASWELPGAGPARRSFALTPAGMTALADLAHHIEALAGRLTASLARYQAVLDEAAEGGRRPTRRRR